MEERMPSVALAITVYRDPSRLDNLLKNIEWSGRPDIPMYVFEDPSPYSDREAITKYYQQICSDHDVNKFETSPKWGCMQGIIQFALENTSEDWIIYIPDDVMFTRGGLWNEYGGILTYGRDFVGVIQAPYWNAVDLVEKGVMPHREAMLNGKWLPLDVPQNPHWNGPGVPRSYVNANGAGFSISRKLFKAMGGWPQNTWRLDEWAGFQAWEKGMVCITLPGQPRIHYFGGATPLLPNPKSTIYYYSSPEEWHRATGMTPDECGDYTRGIMSKIQPSGTWNDILDHFEVGGGL